jgi:hypothetical protein
MSQERTYRRSFSNCFLLETASPGSVRPPTMGLISAGRGRIYRPAEHFLALSSIDFVFLSPAFSIGNGSAQRRGHSHFAGTTRDGAAFHDRQE